MNPKLNLPSAHIQVTLRGDRKYLFDIIRRKWIVLTPEEWVRQNLIHYLIRYKGYPASLIQVETELMWNRMRLRTDVMVSNKTGQPAMIIECKAPAVKLSSSTFEQIAKYNQKYRVPYLLVSNGLVHYCCEMDYEQETYHFLPDIPEFSSLDGSVTK